MEIIKIPFYAKVALIFIAGYAFIYALYLGQNIIVPIVYSTIVAILLNPFVNYLQSKKVGKVVSICIAVSVVVFISACLTFLIFTQLSMLADTYPQLEIKTASSTIKAVQWVSTHFNIRIEKVKALAESTKKTAFINVSFFMKETLFNLSGTIVVLLLLPVYLFMILYYKPLLLEFLRKLFRSVHHGAVVQVLERTKKIIQGYLVGLLLEALVIAVLNSIALLALGIDYAIVLGISGALLNVVPYIGGIIAIALPMITAYVTKDSAVYPLLVLAVYMVIQFVDNHYIIPRIVASKVKINALVSVIVVLIGGAIWGIPGMFLSIPLTAILKVIFDHIETLQPWGFLLGNIVPTATKFSFIKIKK